MRHLEADLREVARYNLGRKKPTRLAALFFLCLLIPFLAMCALSLSLYPPSFPWIVPLSGGISIFLYRYQYKKILEKEMDMSEQKLDNMTVDKMRKLVQEHADLENKLDLDGVLATLVDNPVYEFHPDRLRLEGKENIRQFYREHFDKFFPLIKSHVLINECWDANSACLEYDLYLKPPYNPERAYRITVVLTEENARLVGERFHVENELARLMAGSTYSNFVKF